MTLADHYARFANQLEWAQLPAEVRLIALELFADWFANAAAGHDSPLTQALRSLAPNIGAAGRALCIGDLQAADPLSAALINASASHANEFDDSYRAGLYHPGAPIQAAALSAACIAEVSGTALLTAVVAGYEISLRLAAAINPAHYTIWHTTGTVGAFGAAAASARALGLTAQQTTGAFGLAGTQAAGLWEVLPDAPQAKNLHPAKAAHSGLLAALLAQKGIQGPASILEGKQGFFAATVPAPVDAEQCLAGLGEQWLTLDTTFKAYPVCGHTMTPIEASLELFGQSSPAEVESVEVRAHPVSIQIAGDPFPADEAQAKFSIPYCVAVTLLKGRAGQEEFSPQLIGDAAIQDLLARITLVADDSLSTVEGQRPARVTLRLKGGRTLTAMAEVRKGDPEWPMTADEKRNKCIRLMNPVWGNQGAERIHEAIARLPATANVMKWAEGLHPLIERVHHEQARQPCADRP